MLIHSWQTGCSIPYLKTCGSATSPPLQPQHLLLLPGTDKMLTDVAMVPPILMAGIKSTGYKSKMSDRTLTGATLEIEILSQCGESTMKDFKPSPMNHGKGSVAGQLVPVE